MHPASSVGNENPILIQCFDGEKNKIFSIGIQNRFIRCESDGSRIAKRTLFVSCDDIPLFVVGECDDTSFLIRELPVPRKDFSVGVVNFYDPLAFSLKEELYLRSIGIDPHIDKLSHVKIPVGKDMNHRTGFVVGPCRLVHIEGIFFKTGCVYLSKIRIFGKIWRGLT